MDGYGGNPYASAVYGANPYFAGAMGNRIPQQSVHVDQVDGEKGARDLPMPPNSENKFLVKPV